MMESLEPPKEIRHDPKLVFEWAGLVLSIEAGATTRRLAYELITGKSDNLLEPEQPVDNY